MRVIKQAAKLLNISVQKEYGSKPRNQPAGKATFEFQTDHRTAVVLLTSRGIWGRAQIQSYYPDRTDLEVIKPMEFRVDEPSPVERASEEAWFKIMRESEAAYKFLCDNGCAPSTAVTVLPDARREQITISADFAQWLDIFRKHATSPDSLRQTRELMWLALRQLIDSPVGDMFQPIVDAATCGEVV